MTKTTSRPTLSIADFRATIGDVIAKVTYTHRRILITRYGKPAAAVISVEDLAYFEELEAAARKPGTNEGQR